MSTVGDDYPKQQKRCRELLEIYKGLGPSGIFGAMMIEQTLKEAEEAAISGDLIRMLNVYKRMKDHE